jgi:hypothetical protein
VSVSKITSIFVLKSYGTIKNQICMVNSSMSKIVILEKMNGTEQDGMG